MDKSALADSIVNHEQLVTADLISTLLVYFTGLAISNEDERYQQYALCKPALLRLHAEDAVGFLRVAQKIKEQLGIPTGTIRRDIELLAATQVRAQQTRAASTSGADCPYAETPAGIVWRKPSPGGAIEIPLSNFTARITADLCEDDGVEIHRLFEVETRQGPQGWR